MKSLQRSAILNCNTIKTRLQTTFWPKQGQSILYGKQIIWIQRQNFGSESASIQAFCDPALFLEIVQNGPSWHYRFRAIWRALCSAYLGLWHCSIYSLLPILPFPLSINIVDLKGFCQHNLQQGLYLSSYLQNQTRCNNIFFSFV